MGAWRGDQNNPVPNKIQEPIERSEKFVGDNRALHVRRDKDTQKDITISLYDIDETMLTQLSSLQLQVEDVGKQVKVPVTFGSPELWTSAARDGYVRDKQGKIILPLMILKRTTSESDPSLQYFNRYLTTTAIRLNSPKNQYTRFDVLVGQNAPVHEVYNIVFPSHMVLTYHCIIWTEYVVQMNKLVETIQFNTKDYWGSRKGFRFRTRVESFGHTVELQADDDRIVKTEFDLITNGYILPDTITKLDRHKLTTEKMFTPKKIIMGTEVVSTGFDFNKLDTNSEKWRNPDYPNLQADVPIPTAPMTFPIVPLVTVLPSGVIQVLGIWHFPAPQNSSDPGVEGWISYDDDYYYIFAFGQWKRAPKTLVNSISSVAGEKKWTSYDHDYIYMSGTLDRIPMSLFNLF